MEKEKEQGNVASSASVTTPSTTSASTGSNTTTNPSSRQQAVPQISVYGGITDRQTVQVEISQQTASPHKLHYLLAPSTGHMQQVLLKLIIIVVFFLVTCV